MLDRSHLGVLDVDAKRNAFGRQVRSFETDLSVLGDERFLDAVRACGG